VKVRGRGKEGRAGEKGVERRRKVCLKGTYFVSEK